MPAHFSSATTGASWRALSTARAYTRWLTDDPRDLMRPVPAERMRMWPISTRINKPENDDPAIVDPVELATDAA
jgi:putative SOS response-associated peptidase YedK